jgi:hypothetical protein
MAALARKQSETGMEYLVAEVVEAALADISDRRVRCLVVYGWHCALFAVY